MEKPIFTITGNETGKKYKIYLNGDVEGFDEDVSIFNQIPSTMSSDTTLRQEDLINRLFKKLQDLTEEYGYSKDYFFLSNPERTFKSVDEHSVLAKPNFSIRTVQCSKAKEDK